MERNVAIFQHVANEPAGIIEDFLAGQNVPFRYIRIFETNEVPRVRASHLVFMGGPMSVNDERELPWLVQEKALIRESVSAGRPVLGICLGAQLIAQALGARVFAGEKREVGWAPVTLTDDGKDDPLFAGGDPSLTVFHLHGDTYELPPDARNLARTAAYEQQAFRWGEVVYGFQFHLEFTDSIIARLASEAESKRYIEEAGVDAQKVVAESPARVRALTDVAQSVFGNYFRQCGL